MILRQTFQKSLWLENSVTIQEKKVGNQSIEMKSSQSWFGLASRKLLLKMNFGFSKWNHPLSIRIYKKESQSQLLA